MDLPEEIEGPSCSKIQRIENADENIEPVIPVSGTRASDIPIFFISTPDNNSSIPSTVTLDSDFSHYPHF